MRKFSRCAARSALRGCTCAEKWRARIYAPSCLPPPSGVTLVRPDLSHRTDGELLREFSALVVKDCRSTSEMLAYVGEIQSRRLFRPAGYSSMYWFCVHELHMSEDMAWKRTRVARLARRFPVILDMIAAGRLHLTAVVKLLPYRNAQDFVGLLEAAAHKTKPEIELLLAERFPRPDAPTEVRPLATSSQCQKLVPEPVVQTHITWGASTWCSTDTSPAPPSEGPTPAGPVALGQASSVPGQLIPEPVESPAPRARVEPLAPQRFAIQVTVGQGTHDKLRRAQDLLGHQVAPGDLEQVLDRALEALLRQLEHAKFAATDKPRAARQVSTSGRRHIPAAVKRAVYARDGGQCTFVSESGHRCEERRDLQYDHVDPFARGGEATVERMRLLCKPHNQYEAERVYGAGFMERKREEASRREPAKRETRTAHADPARRPGPSRRRSCMREAAAPPLTNHAPNGTG